ncbi:MAG: hypothetical protein D6784_11610 [Chloroflexi bacterium]|nr:MAG: hypothetical protein D6784_11610 [Chloroflexota bacterium]
MTGRLRLWLLLFLLVLPVLACGLTNPTFARNNQVRLAVYEYEMARRGPVDELVIYFQRNEPRVVFPGQAEHGRTIWLYNFAARDYFDNFPPGKTYLFIQRIEYSDDNSTATVEVYRGDKEGYTGRRLTLQRDQAGQWQVVEDTLLVE